MSQSKFSVHFESTDPLPMNRMPSSLSTSEGLSALLDDELEDEAVAALLADCAHDEAALDCWSRYHLIGEVLRAPGRACAGVAPHADLAFVGRLSQRLAQEVVAPPLAPAAPALVRQPVVALAAPGAAAANDGHFRWKLLAGVASLAVISAMAWKTTQPLAPGAAPALAGAASTQILVASPQGTMVRDTRLQELLAAHNQFGATSVLQEPSGFLHSAAFELSQHAGGGR